MKVNLALKPVLCRINSEIEKFAKVDDVLYRGALPSPAQFMELKRQGIEYIINLHSGFNPKGRLEKDYVEKLGFKYMNFPIDSRVGPCEEVIDGFFQFMDFARSNNKKVFMHCRHGQDRTGTMVALYEMKYNVKPHHDIFLEMHAFGYNYSKHPNLFETVKKYAQIYRNP